MSRSGGLAAPRVGKLLRRGVERDERIGSARWTPEVSRRPRVADARWVAEAGRVVLVLMPCYTLMGPRFSTGVGLAAASLLAAVWLVSLRSAFAAVHFTLGAAGPLRRRDG